MIHHFKAENLENLKKAKSEKQKSRLCPGFVGTGHICYQVFNLSSESPRISQGLKEKNQKTK